VPHPSLDILTDSTGNNSGNLRVCIKSNRHAEMIRVYFSKSVDNLVIDGKTIREPGDLTDMVSYYAPGEQGFNMELPRPSESRLKIWIESVSIGLPAHERYPDGTIAAPGNDWNSTRVTKEFVL